MITPFPTQIVGADWLSGRRNALLADAPRCGKTGTAIMACDDRMEASVLVVTTASGRAVWERAWGQWSPFGRSVQVMQQAKPATADVVIVSWGGVNRADVRAELLKRTWDRLILDESHFAKSFDAQRTRAVYGDLVDGGRELFTGRALLPKAKGVWALSGTPVPNAPNDLYPMLRALFPERLRNGTDVTEYQTFLHRYCKVRMKTLPRGFRKIPVVMGGRNLDELQARMEGLMLRRTQADVGIRQPIYETLPLLVSAKQRRELDGDLNRARILAAAEAGDTRTLEMELGPLRRHTGAVKAGAVIEAVKDEFAAGLDKVVIAFWHREVGARLLEGLSSYGVVGIDGSTPGNVRGEAEQRFLHDPKVRVFLGQIQAAGEAIDLSSSAELIFAETSLVPKDMAQMSLRVTNLTRDRTPRVRVATLAGSIDEALEEVLLRKWAAIRELVKGEAA